MAQFVSIQQAARNALATWLAAQLASVTGGVVVKPRWFQRQLPPKAIAVIDAGPRRVVWTQPAFLAGANGGTPEAPTVNAVWNLGVVEQRLQLDVWCPSEVELDDIIARLDLALNAGCRGIGQANAIPVEAGLLLNLADGWQPGTADYLFEEPDVDQSPSSVNESEWRATYRGVVAARLVGRAVSPRIARVNIKQRLYTADPVDLTEPPDTTTINSSS